MTIVLHRSQIFIICFSDNDRDKCFQFTMTKSVKNLIDNIGNVCQELKKSNGNPSWSAED